MCVSGSSASSFSLSHLICLLGRFFKALIGRAHDVQDAMAKLERLSIQEDKVIAADTHANVKQMNLDLTAMTRESYGGRDCVDR